MSKQPKYIFSGDYSGDMWKSVNSAKTKKQLRRALYFVCCRLQELECRLMKNTENVLPQCKECGSSFMWSNDGSVICCNPECNTTSVICPMCLEEGHYGDECTNL